MPDFEMLDSVIPQLYLIALTPIAFAIGPVLINGMLKPIFIPSAEIDAIAADLIRRFEDPLGAAMIEEHAAWYRSDNFSQGKWRRVRKRVLFLRKAGV